ncbi:hypothetical protein L6452_06488 [Arctium lappa]|uniref:Uncharacterized protein n=1 Tax=Arctium lappa TaxID=4217 RepID=A0ACB9EJT6_ARCLA|nr:hypothetical protein L6452_06488 [Arctium lappa]
MRCFTMLKKVLKKVMSNYILTLSRLVSAFFHQSTTSRSDSRGDGLDFGRSVLDLAASDGVPCVTCRSLITPEEKKDAGLTHIHLLPTFQFANVDDEKDTWKFVDMEMLKSLPPDSAEQHEYITTIQDEDCIVNGYYLRRNADGFIENNTCVNNTASEHFMVDRLIVDDLLNWAHNYKLTISNYINSVTASFLDLKAAIDSIVWKQSRHKGQGVYSVGDCK